MPINVNIKSNYKIHTHIYVYTKFDRILTKRVTFTFALYLDPFTTDNITSRNLVFISYSLLVNYRFTFNRFI